MSEGYRCELYRQYGSCGCGCWKSEELKEAEQAKERMTWAAVILAVVVLLLALYACDDSEPLPPGVDYPDSCYGGSYGETYC